MGKVEIIMRRADKAQILETVLVSFNEKEAEISEPTILSFPKLEIHLKEQVVYRDGNPLLLTRREFSVLTYLARHPKWVFSAKQIYFAVWHKEDGDYGTAVSSIISQLRRKLTPDDPKGGYIRTIVGSGYRLEIP